MPSSFLVFECSRELQTAQLPQSSCFWCWICWYQISVMKLFIIVNSNHSQQWPYLALSPLTRDPYINGVGWSLKMNRSLYNIRIAIYQASPHHEFLQPERLIWLSVFLIFMLSVHPFPLSTMKLGLVSFSHHGSTLFTINILM